MPRSELRRKRYGVNTNVSSINAQRKLTNSTNALNTSYQRLASGLRINSAKDDAAGLQISDRLTAQINGLNQGSRNANDAIALAQTMEGALDETTNMLQRIRTLAIQAAKGTNTTEDRIAIQQEVTQLSAEITRIACKSTCAGKQILAGAGKGLLDGQGRVVFQVGSNVNDTLSVSLSSGFTVSGIASIANIPTTTPGTGPDAQGGSLLVKRLDIVSLCVPQPTPILRWRTSTNLFRRWTAAAPISVPCRTAWSPLSAIRPIFQRISLTPDRASVIPTTLKKLLPYAADHYSAGLTDHSDPGQSAPADRFKSARRLIQLKANLPSDCSLSAAVCGEK